MLECNYRGNNRIGFDATFELKKKLLMMEIRIYYVYVKEKTK